MLPLTMYQSDFQPYKALPVKAQVPPAKTAQLKPIVRSKYRPPQMDLEILQPFKPDVSIPFSLLHRKKCIVQTNPHDEIPKVKLEDTIFEQKLEARSKRPTVYMTPQINLDKIPVDIMYGSKRNEGLVSSIYSSDWKKACDVVVQNSQSKLKDPKDREFSKKDLLQKSMERTRFKAESVIPPMEIGLGKYISMWDKQNPIEFVDRTRMFWEKSKELNRNCLGDSKSALTVEEKMELDDCLKEKTLRTPFTLHPPGYTGYVPNLAPGIPFRKKIFTKYDPFVTTLMTQQGVFDKDSI